MATRARPKLHGQADSESATATAITPVPPARKAARISTPYRPSEYSLSIRHDGSNSGSRKCSSTSRPTASPVTVRE